MRPDKAWIFIGMTKPCSFFDSSIILIMHEKVIYWLETEHKLIMNSSSLGNYTLCTLHGPYISLYILLIYFLFLNLFRLSYTLLNNKQDKIVCRFHLNPRSPSSSEHWRSRPSNLIYIEVRLIINIIPWNKMQQLLLIHQKYTREGH